MRRCGWRGSSDQRSRNHRQQPGIDKNSARGGGGEGGWGDQARKERERER